MRKCCSGWRAIVSEVCQPVVVVAAGDQALPELANDVRVVRDSQPNRGPLQGLRDGLHALPQGAEAAFVTGCDTPLLKARVISHIAAQLGEHDIAAPLVDATYHPLTAVYRVTVRTEAEALLEQGRHSLHALLDACATTAIAAENLRQADPELKSLLNCNRPREYQAVLRSVGQTARARPTGE